MLQRSRYRRQDLNLFHLLIYRIYMSELGIRICVKTFDTCQGVRGTVCC